MAQAFTESQRVQLKQNFERWIDDYSSYASDCLIVRDHNTSELLPLSFRNSQRILHEVCEKAKRDRKYLRVLLLKARRFGGSTYIEGRGYHLTALNYNKNAFIVAHEEESTSTLFKMAKLYHEKNPFPPQTRASNAQEIIFDNKQGTGLKSEYRLATAKNVDAGRAQGVHFLHISEEASFQRGEELLTGLMQCVPKPPYADGTEIFRESTAKGFGNTFQKDVFATYCEGRYPFYEEGGIVYAWYNPDSDWILVFIPWFAHELYSLPFDNQAQKEAFGEKIAQPVFDKEAQKWGDSEELDLKKKYNLTLEQLHWREWCIENDCRGSMEIFNQEYPATVENAFLSRGSNIFSKKLCDELHSMTQTPISTGELVDRGGRIHFRPMNHGHLSIWDWPNEDEDHFITVDTAGGKKPFADKNQKDPDPSCIDVWRIKSGKQVAQWHGQIDYDMIADMVEMIGDYYSVRTDRKKVVLPMACVEINQHGYTVVADLKRKKYPLYEWKPGEPGLHCNVRTDGQMRDALIQTARDGTLQISCPETVSEMRTYVQDGSRHGAATGCHDERVDTAKMAAYLYKNAPFLSRDVRRKKDKQKSIGFSNFDSQFKKTDDRGYIEVRI